LTSEDLWNLQQVLVSEDKLMEIDAELILPKIGGYNARPYNSETKLYEPPRSSEIKALWRSYMRTILSGVFGGEKNYKELENMVSEILGSTNSASCFRVNIVTNRKSIEELEQKAQKIEKLLREIIPRTLLGLKNEFSKYNVATVFLSLSIPITIKFKLKNSQQKQHFENILRNFINVKPIYSNDNAQVILKGSSELKYLSNKLRLSFETNKLDEILGIYDELVKLSEIPRIKLILQPHKSEGEDNKLDYNKLNNGNIKYIERISEELVLPETIPIKIEIYTNYIGHVDTGRICYDERFTRFALQTLLISLILGGIGSFTRRGLGSIIIKSVEIKRSPFKDLEDSIKRIIEENNAKNLEDKLLKFIRNVLEVGKELYKAQEAGKRNHLPKVPSIIPDSKYFKLSVIECPQKDVYDIAKIIGLSSLKQEWKSMKPNAPRESLHTWILGLPRSAKNTGYFVQSNQKIEQGRRISAINLKVFRNINSKTFIIIYGFLSNDWPVDKLIYKSRKNKQEKRLKIKRIEQVFDDAYEFVLKILEKYCKSSSKCCGDE